jgi:hypothetical protein
MEAAGHDLARMALDFLSIPGKSRLIMLYIVEFFTVLLVFLPESSGIQLIPGIPQNRILAVVPAKIGISIPWNSGRFRNGHGINETESTGTESAKFVFLIVIVIFNSNSNYLMVITVD